MSATTDVMIFTGRAAVHTDWSGWLAEPSWEIAPSPPLEEAEA